MKTMKRFVCLLLVVAMLASLPVMASAASYDHVHDYVRKETKAATCTEQGYELYKCKTCDASYKTNYTPSRHEYADGVGTMKFDKDAKKWNYVCNSCNKTIFSVTENDCSADKVETVTETDSNGSVKTTVNGKVESIVDENGKNLDANCFASGAATETSKETVIVYNVGVKSVNGVFKNLDGTAVKTNLDGDATRELIKNLGIENVSKPNSISGGTVSYSGNEATVTVVTEYWERDWLGVPHYKVDKNDYTRTMTGDSETVTTVWTDDNGNVKTEVNGAATYSGGIEAKYFACGDVKATKTDIKYEFHVSTLADKATHATKDMKKDAIKVGASNLADCSSAGKVYSVTTCGGCGMKFYATETVTDAEKCNFPATGNYESDKTYTVKVAATTTKEGCAARVCTACGKEETIMIPRLNATYPAYTTNEIVAVYNEANAGNAQTVSGLKIGNLPKGATVLVMETKNGFSKILAGQTAWVQTSKLTKVNSADVKADCVHTDLKEFYVASATCQFNKMTTLRCEKCDKYYTFAEAANTKLAHTDKGGHAWEVMNDTKFKNFKIENDTAWKITKQPTEITHGEMERVCAVCGYKETATGEKVDILKATGTVNTKAYVNVAVAEIYDTFDSDKKLTFYAVQGSNVTVTGYAIDKTWAFVKVDDTHKGYIKTSQLKLDASSNMSAVYDGALAYAIVADGTEMKVHLNYSETSSLLSTIASGKGFAVYEFAGSSDVWGRIESKTSDKWVKLGEGTVTNAKTATLTKLNGLKSYAPLLRTYAVTSPVGTLTDAIAKGHVTSSINLNIRESASVSAKKLGDFQPADPVFLYEVKTVNGVQWGKVQGMKATNGTITWKEITKADLEDTTKKLVSGWVCMTYVALDTEIAETPSASAPVAAPTGTVTTGGIALNVRKKADVYSDKVGALPNGTKVTIYETANAKNGVQWGRISQNSLDGWVCMQYVTLNAASGTGTGTSTGSAAKVNAAVANCATGVNVRTKSDISGTQIAKIPVGTRIAVTKTENGWGYVDSVKGWVYLEYVAFDAGALEELNKPAAVTPVPVPGVESPITTYTNIVIPALVNNACYVYASTNTSSDVLMTIHERDSIQVIDRAIVSGKLWFKISEGTVTGWIVSDVTFNVWFFGKVQITLISMQALTGTTIASTNVYAEPSVDSNIQTVLGPGSKFSVNAGNEHHFTEGVYTWAELANGGWIQLHNTSLDTTPNASFLPSYSDTPAISASVTNAAGAVLYKEHATTSTPLVTLAKDTTFTVLDWYYESATKSTWGKVTQGQYTGWLVLNSADDNVNVEQVSVGGAVATETLNLYKTCGDTTDVQLILRQGDKVTVTERRLVGNAVWGRMVAAKDTSKRQLWANLAGVTLDGQKTTTSTTPTTPVETPVITTPVTPATVTIGVVVGADSVNVRSDAHVSSALVATVKKGEQVRVSEQKISDGANWGKIEQGWIAMQYVSLKAETVATNPTTNVTTGTTIMTSVPAGAIAAGFVSIDNLAVRSSAGVAMPQVGTLSQGTNVVIYETTYANNLYWGRIDSGWICMSYVVNTAVGVAGTGTPGTVARCFYTVNVRASAGTGSAITGKIMVTSPVQIFETTTYSGELWGRTSIGWVAMQYVA